MFRRLRTQEAMDETFLLTNIAPQVGDGFNRHCKSPMQTDATPRSLVLLSQQTGHT